MPARKKTKNDLGYTIRPALLADLSAVTALAAALWPDESVAGIRAHMRATLAGRPRSSLPLTVFIAAAAEGGAAGFVEVGLRSHAEGCDGRWPVGFVEGWFVAAGVRGRGVGRALMKTAEDWARRQGCREMGSDTWLTNRTAQRVHEALGFRVADRVVAYRKPLPAKRGRRGWRFTAVMFLVTSVARMAVAADARDAPAAASDPRAAASRRQAPAARSPSTGRSTPTSGRGWALFAGVEPLKGRLRGHATALPPEVIRCANCHGAEAQAPGARNPAPPLARALFLEPRSRRGGPSSVYDARSFCKLLRTGVDPVSVMIAREMPTYDIDDAGCAALWRFLVEDEEPGAGKARTSRPAGATSTAASP